MTKPLFILAAAGLALSACAAHPPARTVFVSGPGVHHFVHRAPSVHSHYRGPHASVHRGSRTTVHTYRAGPGRDQVIIIPGPRGAAVDAEARARALSHAEAARRHAQEATRMARLMRPDADAIARITRDAQAAGEAARRAGEAARRQGETARLQGEEARRRGEEIRRSAQRLREQCERGEIRCEIIITE